MSFIDNINAFKVRLENNQALNDFALTKFGKVCAVWKVFHNRTEIGHGDLPLIMITRPNLIRTPSNLSSRKEHTVALYAGFLQYDRLLVLEQFIELDSLLEDAVMAKTNIQGDIPMAVEVTDSTNDEGLYHPVYFMVMQVKVKTK
jgi:hypothetical protein